MLFIQFDGKELWNERTEMFEYIKPVVLQLEHSLVSLSKWEAKWKKPFLDRKEKSNEETIDYIRCMTITQNVDPRVYYSLPEHDIQRVSEYIDDPMTATTFSETQNRKTPGYRETVTSELIYYWMIACQIPFECQKWHLNRLLTLIKVCSVKNQKPEKLGKKGLATRNHSLNAARRAKMHSKG